MINVLLVEDDDLDVMNMQRAFKKNNIKNPLYVARNGIEALQMLHGTSTTQFPQDNRLILLDMNMPKMGGIEFLHALRDDPALKPIPVIMLTSSNEEKDRLAAYNLNVAGYLIKSSEFPAFVEMMAKVNDYWSVCQMI
jgi:CheY-like chemotaxis protein